jgi:hypothetical protein
MEIGGSVSCSQQPAVGLYIELDKHPPTLNLF